jgi:hypothetical protein
MTVGLLLVTLFSQVKLGADNVRRSPLLPPRAGWIGGPVSTVIHAVSIVFFGHLVRTVFRCAEQS